jgi:hypothetical protein
VAYRRAGEREQKKKFFFEKKNQKTFGFYGARLDQRATALKSFLLLFFKKEALAFLATIPRP